MGRSGSVALSGALRDGLILFNGDQIGESLALPAALQLFEGRALLTEALEDLLRGLSAPVGQLNLQLRVIWAD